MLRKFSVHMCSAEILGALTIYIYIHSIDFPIIQNCVYTITKQLLIQIDFFQRKII